jgi:hypothetical protein
MLMFSCSDDDNFKLTGLFSLIYIDSKEEIRYEPGKRSHKGVML